MFLFAIMNFVHLVSTLLSKLSSHRHAGYVSPIVHGGELRRLMVFVLVSVAIVLLGGKAAAYSSEVRQSAHAVPLEYVPNEIIVKFNEMTAAAVEEQLNLKSLARDLKLPKELRMLSARYRVKEIKALFKNFREEQQRLKALWGKSTALLTPKDKHIVRRLKRAPKDANVPDLGSIYRIGFDLRGEQSVEDVLAAYQNHPSVEYAELNYIVSINLTPDDALYSVQWPLNNIGQGYPESGRYNPPPGVPDRDIDAPDAWDKSTGISDIIVAVVDTGLDYTHRDIDDNTWVNETELNGSAGVDDDENDYIDDIYGYDFINEDADPKDDHGHGTHCAGIIAAEGDNELDIAGVCWDARIMALKFLGSDGRGKMTDAAEAFYYAVANGADVISNSWGSWFPSATIKQAVNYAHSQGVILVASAGNDNLDWASYPAYYENVIGVAATDSHDQKASFSNYGDWVDIAAHGVDILSLRAEGTSMGTAYNAFMTIASGTSMACPHVSGACALLLSVDPNVSVDDLRSALMVTADPISPGICDSGRLNVYGAMLRMLGPEGNIWLDSDVYSCFGLIGIKLFDTDLSTNETQEVTVSTDGGDSETLLLAETSPTLGIFVGTVSTGWGIPNVEDGMLQLSHGQIITVTYYDVNDGTGNPAIATDTAMGDCQGPAIFNVEIDVPGPAPTVTYETDEPTTTRVLYSQSCGDPNQIVATDAILATSHGIKLSGVSPESDYFFVVKANDGVGNQTIDDNVGQCYAFTTDKPGDIYVPAKYATIQEAIDHSWDGGTVWVADGSYTGDGNRDIDFRGRAITVCSENGLENCIIDCGGAEENPHRGFYFHSGEGANSVLAGFTITNGYAFGNPYTGRSGGGIRCDSSSPTVTNCKFNGNSARVNGGGMFNNDNSSPTMSDCLFSGNSAKYGGGMFNYDNSSPIVSNCTFSDNFAEYGAGMFNEDNSSPTVNNCTFNCNLAGWDAGGMQNEKSSPTITNCTFSRNVALGNDGGAMDNFWSSPILTNCVFRGNSAYDWAGAIRGIYFCNPTFTNCTFIGNLADDGGGMFYWRQCSPTITNCTFAENFAVQGSALGCGYLTQSYPSNLQLTNCILANGGDEVYNFDASTITITYSNVNGGYPGEGNIDADPCFVQRGCWVDANDANILVEPNDPNAVWVAGDYHLRPGSACIDAASDANVYTDIEGNIRPFDFPCIDNNAELPEFDMGAYEAVIQTIAELLILPQVIERHNPQAKIMALVRLPEGITKNQVDSDVPLVLYPGGVEAVPQCVIQSRRRGVSRTSILAFFGKAELMDAVGDGGRVELQVVGYLETGLYFYGTDIVRIIGRRR